MLVKNTGRQAAFKIQPKPMQKAPNFFEKLGIVYYNRKYGRRIFTPEANLAARLLLYSSAALALFRLGAPVALQETKRTASAGLYSGGHLLRKDLEPCKAEPEGIMAGTKVKKLVLSSSAAFLPGGNGTIERKPLELNAEDRLVWAYACKVNMLNPTTNSRLAFGGDRFDLAELVLKDGRTAVMKFR